MKVLEKKLLFSHINISTLIKSKSYLWSRWPRWPLCPNFPNFALLKGEKKPDDSIFVLFFQFRNCYFKIHLVLLRSCSRCFVNVKNEMKHAHMHKQRHF